MGGSPNISRIELDPSAPVVVVGQARSGSTLATWLLNHGGGLVVNDAYAAQIAEGLGAPGPFGGGGAAAAALGRGRRASDPSADGDDPGDAPRGGGGRGRGLGAALGRDAVRRRRRRRARLLGLEHAAGLDACG